MALPSSAILKSADANFDLIVPFNNNQKLSQNKTINIKKANYSNLFTDGLRHQVCVRIGVELVMEGTTRQDHGKLTGLAPVVLP